MSIDEYLCQVKKLWFRSERLFEKYKAAEEDAQAITTKYNFGMPSSKTNKNHSEERLIRMITAKDRWQLALLDYLEARQDLFSFIIQLPAEECDLLHYRYIKIKTMDQISDEWEQINGCAMSKRQLFRILIKAKDDLKQLLIVNGRTIE